MSTDDVARLERHLTRENQSLRELISLGREEASKDHEQVRAEMGQIRARVDHIASRLEAVEDLHAEETAQDRGARQTRDLLGRLTVNIITLAVGLCGLWFVASDHLK